MANVDRALVAILTVELRRTREWTERSLARLPAGAWWRPAPWTECTAGWHLGHLAWKLDDDAARYFGAARALDAGWEARFYGAAPLDPADAPDDAALLRAFRETHARFVALVAELRDADLARSSPDWPDGSVLGAIANVLVHEGEHLAGIDAVRWWFERASAAAPR